MNLNKIWRVSLYRELVTQMFAYIGFIFITLIVLLLNTNLMLSFIFVCRSLTGGAFTLATRCMVLHLLCRLSPMSFYLNVPPFRYFTYFILFSKMYLDRYVWKKTVHSKGAASVDHKLPFAEGKELNSSGKIKRGWFEWTVIRDKTMFKVLAAAPSLTANTWRFRLWLIKSDIVRHSNQPSVLRIKINSLFCVLCVFYITPRSCFTLSSSFSMIGWFWWHSKCMIKKHDVQKTSSSATVTTATLHQLRKISSLVNSVKHAAVSLSVRPASSVRLLKAIGTVEQARLPVFW